MAHASNQQSASARSIVLRSPPAGRHIGGSASPGEPARAGSSEATASNDGRQAHVGGAPGCCLCRFSRVGAVDGAAKTLKRPPSMLVLRRCSRTAPADFASGCGIQRFACWLEVAPPLRLRLESVREPAKPIFGSAVRIIRQHRRTEIRGLIRVNQRFCPATLPSSPACAAFALPASNAIRRYHSPTARRPTLIAMLDKAGLPVTTVDDWARRGILPSRKIGRRRIYIRQDIEVLLIAPSSSGD